jgi:hypothetical protein
VGTAGNISRLFPCSHRVPTLSYRLSICNNLLFPLFPLFPPKNRKGRKVTQERENYETVLRDIDVAQGFYPMSYEERERAKFKDRGGMRHAVALYARSLEACRKPDRHPNLDNYMCGLLCDAYLRKLFQKIAHLYAPKPLRGLLLAIAIGSRIREVSVSSRIC